MRRHVMPGLVALVASTIYVQASTHGPAAGAAAVPQTRVFAHRTVGSRGDRQRREGEPLRARARHRVARFKTGRAEIPAAGRQGDDDPAAARGEYKFTGKKALAVTAITAEGVESKPLAATGGPDLADVRFSAEPTERDALLSTKHLDIRTEDATVRLSFEGLDEAQPAFKQCLANIGSPAKGWSDAEFEQISSR